MAESRRDFIKWVVYLGAAAALPKCASPEEYPHDVLEGISRVHKKIADLTGNAVKFRMEQDASFEDCMHGMWQEYNRSDRYVRVFQDRGVVPSRTFTVLETNEVIYEPESYVSFFQYRRV